MLAHRVATLLVTKSEAKDFYNMFLTEASNAVKKNPKIYAQWQLMFAAGIAKVIGLSNHETFFVKQLLTNGATQVQIDSSLKQISYFYNSIKMVKD